MGRQKYISEETKASIRRIALTSEGKEISDVFHIKQDTVSSPTKTVHGETRGERRG